MGNVLMIIVGIVILLFVLKMVFKVAKLVIYTIILFVVGTVAVHMFSPSTIDGVIGAENHTKITNFVTNKVSE